RRRAMAENDASPSGRPVPGVLKLAPGGKQPHPADAGVAADGDAALRSGAQPQIIRAALESVTDSYLQVGSPPLLRFQLVRKSVRLSTKTIRSSVSCAVSLSGFRSCSPSACRRSTLISE